MPVAALTASDQDEVRGFARLPEVDRYFDLLRRTPALRYIGETEKNLGVAERRDRG